MAKSRDESKGGQSTLSQPFSTPIGDVVKAWREERGWSVTEFAEKVEMSKSYISSLENNRIKQPAIERIAQLADSLGIDVWDLIARRIPDQEDGGEKKNTGQKTPTTSPKVLEGKQSHQIRFGSGFPIIPSRSQNDILRDILQRLEEIKLMIEEFLRAENEEVDE